VYDLSAPQFTAKERDAETGLDYLGARYFSGAQGRLTSPDPKQFSLRTFANPQKWNKYAYTLNDPLALIDPDGKEEVTADVDKNVAAQSLQIPNHSTSSNRLAASA
jgi:RHS repeat-associated protein